MECGWSVGRVRGVLGMGAAKPANSMNCSPKPSYSGLHFTVFFFKHTHTHTNFVYSCIFSKTLKPSSGWLLLLGLAGAMNTAQYFLRKTVACEGNREEEGGSETIVSDVCLCEALPLIHSTNTPGCSLASQALLTGNNQNQNACLPRTDPTVRKTGPTQTSRMECIRH